jgi:hypothetical protein
MEKLPFVIILVINLIWGDISEEAAAAYLIV